VVVEEILPKAHIQRQMVLPK